LAAAVVSVPQDRSSPPSGEATQAREEIQTIEKWLPQIPDRVPALFELAHDYALLGDVHRALSLPKECMAFNEGFDPEGDPVLNELKEQP
jgi:hypothetical protein